MTAASLVRSGAVLSSWDEGARALLVRAGFKLRGQDLTESLAAVVDPATGWYRRWHFLLRLDEEMEQARRSDTPVAIVAFRLPAAALSPLAGDRLRDALTRIVEEALGPGDVPGCLHEDELAVLLPRTSLEAARRLLARLKAELEPFSPWLGVAAFPEDGRYGLELLATATAYQSRPPAPVFDLEAHRLLRRVPMAA
jgi:GGDEF domain-containing protein